MILFHDVDENIPGNVITKPSHYLPSFVLFARHDEMPHQEPFLGDPVGGEAQIADLGVHGSDALHRRTGVIVRFEQPLRRRLGPDLEVRQVDIDQPVEQVERLQRIERGRVVDDGHAQAQLPGAQHGQHDLRDHVLRRDQIDVVHPPHVLQLQVPRRQLPRRGVEAPAPVRDVVVLAKDAAEVAAGEEDGAGAGVALDAGFLAEVRGDDVDRGGFRADQAEARLDVAVDAAAAGAEVAVPEVGVRGGLLPCCVG